MLTLSTDQLSTQEIQQYLQYAIAPLPICFASTIDLEGNVNLSPFSFFNLFSMNPPICIFSPSRRVRDNTTKHTLENIKMVPECVINIVNYEMVQQMSLASCDYPKGTNEFIKAGFTPLASELVKPPRVAEAPIQLECIVQEVITLGENAEENLFKVEKPNTKLGIGFDQLPIGIITNELLTQNEKAQLANYDILPESNVQEIAHFSYDKILKIKLALANQETVLAWEIIRTSI